MQFVSDIRIGAVHPYDKPWIDPELKVLIGQRQQVMSKDQTTFRRLRNKVKRLNNRPRSSIFDRKVQSFHNTALW